MDWRDQALCAQSDPEAWFPEKGESARAAKRICQGRPVRTPCLADALAHHEQWGVRGGLSAQERQRLSHAGEQVAA